MYLKSALDREIRRSRERGASVAGGGGLQLAVCGRHPADSAGDRPPLGGRVRIAARPRGADASTNSQLEARRPRRLLHPSRSSGSLCPADVQIHPVHRAEITPACNPFPFAAHTLRPTSFQTSATPRRPAQQVRPMPFQPQTPVTSAARSAIVGFAPAGRNSQRLVESHAWSCPRSNSPSQCSPAPLPAQPSNRSSPRPAARAATRRSLQHLPVDRVKIHCGICLSSPHRCPALRRRP